MIKNWGNSLSIKVLFYSSTRDFFPVLEFRDGPYKWKSNARKHAKRRRSSANVIYRKKESTVSREIPAPYTGSSYNGQRKRHQREEYKGIDAHLGEERKKKLLRAREKRRPLIVRARGIYPCGERRRRLSHRRHRRRRRRGRSGRGGWWCVCTRARLLDCE